MPRKKVRRLSPQETKALLNRLLAPTQPAWQERDMRIRQVCLALGADPDSDLSRHMVFGYLAYFAPAYLVPDLYPRTKKPKTAKIVPKDMEVITIAAHLFAAAVGSRPWPEKVDMKIIRKAVSFAVEYAEEKGILERGARGTNMRRITRKLAQFAEQQAMGQK
jgi:hypothetical protein